MGSLRQLASMIEHIYSAEAPEAEPGDGDAGFDAGPLQAMLLDDEMPACVTA